MTQKQKIVLIKPRVIMINLIYRGCTAVRLHVYLVFVKSIEQELKIQ